MTDNNNLLSLTSTIVAAYLSNNTVAIGDISGVVSSVYGSLVATSVPAVVEAPVAVKQEPAVSIRASIKPDFIVCLEDGKKMKMLKRHLMTRYGMTPDDYRAKWNLPKDYPMVAPSYATKRRDLALKIGLGNKSKATTEAVAA
jgi:predicted transcriptional regulator